MLHRLLCLLGFHNLKEVGDPEYHAFGGTERCAICGKEFPWSNSFR